MLSEGESLHLYCKISGYPRPHITWYKDGQLLEGADERVTFLPYDGMENGHLIVFNVNENEAGRYVCKAVTDIFPPSSSALEVKISGDFLKIAYNVYCLLNKPF